MTEPSIKKELNYNSIILMVIIFFTTLQVAIVGALAYTVYDLKNKILTTVERDITALSTPSTVTEKLPQEMRIKFIADDKVLLVPVK